MKISNSAILGVITGGMLGTVLSLAVGTPVSGVMVGTQAIFTLILLKMFYSNRKKRAELNAQLSEIDKTLDGYEVLAGNNQQNIDFVAELKVKAEAIRANLK